MLKKAFWDTWDNLGRILLINTGFLLLTAGGFYLPRALADIPVVSIFVLFVFLLLLFVYAGGVAPFIRDLVYYKSPELRDIGGHLKKNWKLGLTLGMGVSLFYFTCFTGFRFYSALGSVPGLLGMTFLFWIFLIVSMALIYFFPIMTNLDHNLKKILKKSFILFFDNTGTSLVLAFMMIFNAALSIMLAFILPGMEGILVLQESAMKLLLLKYDYLEEHPEADRKKIPWAALIMEERERVGKRTLKGTIFPWKE